MQNILSDSSEFSEICITKEKHLNFLINTQKQITDLLKQLNDSQVISDTDYKNLKPRGSRSDFEKLLRMALQNNFFNFDRKIYKQTDGVVMGSPFMGPSLANAFLCFHEQIWLNDFPEDFKPGYYRRYVDDLFALFHSPDHLENFTSYLNSFTTNIKLVWFLPCYLEHFQSSLTFPGFTRKSAI